MSIVPRFSNQSLQPPSHFGSHFRVNRISSDRATRLITDLAKTSATQVVSTVYDDGKESVSFKIKDYLNHQAMALLKRHKLTKETLITPLAIRNVFDLAKAGKQFDTLETAQYFANKANKTQKLLGETPSYEVRSAKNPSDSWNELSTLSNPADFARTYSPFILYNTRLTHIPTKKAP